MRYSSRGGLKFPVRYAMNRQRIVSLSPETVAIPLPVAAEILPEVKPGAKVLFGQPLIAFSEAYAPVFSSVSGVISAVEDHLLASGKHATVITIQSDGENTPHDTVHPCRKRLVDLSSEEIISAVEHAGLVFPELAGGSLAETLRASLQCVTHLAVSVVDTEPPVHVGAVLAANLPKEIIGGARILMKTLGIGQIVLCVGKKDPYGTARLKNAIGKSKRFRILRIAEKYPMDHPAILGRTVLKKMAVRRRKNAPLPQCLVLGAEACVAVYRLFALGEPMVRRILPVGGNCVSDTAVVSAPVGTSQSDLLAACKVRRKPKLILDGGYLRGRSVCAVDVPLEVTRVSVVARSHSKKDHSPFPPVCIRCGRCASVCPAGLFPGGLRDAVLRKDWKAAEEGLLSCIGCGLCSYICPGKVDVSGDIAGGFWGSAEAFLEEELLDAPSAGPLTEEKKEEGKPSALAVRLAAYDADALSEEVPEAETEDVAEAEADDVTAEGKIPPEIQGEENSENVMLVEASVDEIPGEAVET